MVLDLDDNNIQASLKLMPNNMARLTITYPRVQPYSTRVLTYLFRLLQPAPTRRGKRLITTPTNATRD